MKKIGEKLKSATAHIVFVLAILLGLYVVINGSVELTGNAVLDPVTAKAQLETALASNAMFSQVASGSLCVAINDPQGPMSLRAVKSSAGWAVTETTGYCTGLNNEDLVVQFPDYDTYSKILENPSPRNIISGAISQEYEILPSRYVEQGGNVVCDATFRVKFCSALKDSATPEQLIEGDLSCCLDTLTSSQRKLLEKHVEDGRYKDETGALETAGGIAGMSMMTSIIGLAVVVLVIAVVVVAILIRKPSKKPGPTPSAKKLVEGGGTGSVGRPASLAPTVAAGNIGGQVMPGATAVVSAPTQTTESPQVTQLRQYVGQVMSQGYTPDQINAHLQESGWDAATSERIINEVYESLINRGG